MAKDGKKKPFVFRFIRTFLIIIIILAAAWTGFSLIGRVKAARVIPDTADLYFQVPNPALLFKDLINHEPLPDILALPELKQALPVFNLIKNSGLQENKFISLAAGRKLEGALVTGYGQTSGENFLAAWDMGLLSPALRFLPLLAGRISIPGLYYVKGGKYSRFEFRTDEKTYYLGPYRNLLIITDNSTLFETVLSGKSGNGASDREIRSKNYDAAFILSPDFLKNLISGDDNPAANTLDFLQFGGPLEAAISIKPRQIDISLSGQISTNQADIEKIISANSTAPDLYSMVPDDTQYLTVLSAGTLGDILNAASAIPGAEIEDPWKKADSASKSLLGMDLNELLLSWTGNEFAVFGMTGRDSPVIVVQVKDEKKRQDVFSRVFNSVFINENNRLNLDGTRLPRIELPAFLNNVLMGMGIKIPSPYYSI
ncbi:MAG: hypothetical protein FWF22_05420, partial [Treponema sp.]|nr:hypothetical protein [Treponema sp.]